MVRLDLQDGEPPEAIVVGLDSLNGIQAAHILARHRIPIIGIAKDPKHYGCWTRVCKSILYADTGSEEFVRLLEDMGPKLKKKAVLVPCTDMTVLLISRNRDRLKHWYRITLPSQGVVETLMNKVSFYTYAQRNGLPIPVTRFVSSREDAERAARDLTFPCVLKPPISAIPAWEQNSKSKAYKASTAAELLYAYERCKVWTRDLIVQEWVMGPDRNLYSCNCYLDDHSKPLATFVARKLRQWPPVTGESCLGEECRDDVVLEETIRLFQSVGFRGLGYVEIKQDERSGNYFILEPNIGRPTGRSSIAEAGGVELLYTMYCDTVGWPLPENRQQTYGNVKWMAMRRDAQSALYHWRAGDLTVREWWHSVRGPKAYALFSLSDPGPFCGDLVRGFRLYLSAEERSKRNYRDL
jgi:predicted ATP-grasp superfamily ATP-dependent carboligase